MTHVTVGRQGAAPAGSTSNARHRTPLAPVQWATGDNGEMVVASEPGRGAAGRNETERAPLRADARRNRRRVLDAAAEAFWRDGPPHPWRRQARRAGVGVGTLYRRFPDRSALVLEVVRDGLEQLLARTLEEANAEGDAWSALVRTLEHGLELDVIVRVSSRLPRDLAAIVNADPTVLDLTASVLAATTELVERAQAEGAVRDDISAYDVMQLTSLVVYAPHVNADARALRRARALVFDSLRTGARVELPGAPLAADELQFN